MPPNPKQNKLDLIPGKLGLRYLEYSTLNIAYINFSIYCEKEGSLNKSLSRNTPSISYPYKQKHLDNYNVVYFYYEPWFLYPPKWIFSILYNVSRQVMASLWIDDEHKTVIQ